MRGELVSRDRQRLAFCFYSRIDTRGVIGRKKERCTGRKWATRGRKDKEGGFRGEEASFRLTCQRHTSRRVRYSPLVAMERTRCPNCGHPSPPSSPGMAADEAERRSSPPASWDFLDSRLGAPPARYDEVKEEPTFASDLYRPLWDFLGLTILGVCSLLRTKSHLLSLLLPLSRSPMSTDPPRPASLLRTCLFSSVLLP